MATLRNSLPDIRQPEQTLAHSLDNAPVEDEELTDEMAMVLEQARASLARGRSISHEEIQRGY